MSSKYTVITSAFRGANSLEDLREVHKSFKDDIKAVFDVSHGTGLAILEAYIYYYKILTGEELGNGLFKGLNKESFIRCYLYKAGVKSQT